MRRSLPVLVLAFLATFIGEVVFGATTLSRIGGLIVVAPLYGGGAVLIRELARRQGAGWWRIALLAAAYGIIEEGIAIQSMFNPNLFNAGLLGARWFAFNWVWAQWTLGYHIIWSITIPILLTEMLFPARRSEAWLRRTGVMIAGVLYALSVFALGAIFRFVITPDFRAPLFGLLALVLVAAALVAAALWGRSAPVARAQATRNPPSPWVVGLLVAITALAWFVLLDIPHLLRDSILVIVPMIGLIILVGVVASKIHRWSAFEENWNDLHRFAIICGALLISMLVGFFFVTASNPIDQLGQGIASIGMIIFLALFGWRLRERTRLTTNAVPQHV